MSINSSTLVILNKPDQNNDEGFIANPTKINILLDDDQWGHIGLQPKTELLKQRITNYKVIKDQHSWVSDNMETVSDSESQSSEENNEENRLGQVLQENREENSEEHRLGLVLEEKLNEITRDIDDIKQEVRLRHFEKLKAFFDAHTEISTTCTQAEFEPLWDKHIDGFSEGLVEALRLELARVLPDFKGELMKPAQVEDFVLEGIDFRSLTFLSDWDQNYYLLYTSLDLLKNFI